MYQGIDLRLTRIPIRVLLLQAMYAIPEDHPSLSEASTLSIRPPQMLQLISRACPI
jgi:methyl coenzyme M reductase subunit C